MRQWLQGCALCCLSRTPIWISTIHIILQIITEADSRCPATDALQLLLECREVSSEPTRHLALHYLAFNTETRKNKTHKTRVHWFNNEKPHHLKNRNGKGNEADTEKWKETQIKMLTWWTHWVGRLSWPRLRVRSRGSQQSDHRSPRCLLPLLRP